MWDLTVDDCVRAIQERNAELKAVLHVLDAPLGDADGAARRGEPNGNGKRPLAGVPYVLKDVWDTAGMRTTGGSWRHRERVPTESSRIYEALRDTGAVLLGKSNLCDLAFSPESDNHLIGATKNPLDTTRTSGGSTGGGAAAVAAGMAAFDWGTDFGGSVRMPAAFCGVVGLRLSAETWPVNEDHFPRVPRHFWSWLSMGPITRTVAENRAVVHAMKALRLPGAPPAMRRDEVVIYGPDERCAREWPTFVGEASTALMKLGVKVDADRDLPSSSDVNELFNAYLSAHFEDFASGDEITIKEGLGAVLLGLVSRGRLDRRIHPNTGVLFALVALGRVLVHRNVAPSEARLAELRAAARRVWATGRLIVSPMATVPAPHHGRAGLDWTLQAFAKLGNLTDATAIAIPFGRFDGGLPRSLQILGPPGSEEAVLDLAERIEESAAL